MQMPGRKYQQGSSSYRFSINGQEKEKELNENITTALYWEYDSRIVRRWNPDPVYKHSPYECFGSNPIWFSDKNGSDSTVYLYSHTSKVSGSAANGPSKGEMKKILNNIRNIYKANGLKHLKFKLINEKDFTSGMLKLDPSDAILGITGVGVGNEEGKSYINENGNTLPGTTTGENFGFPYYSTSSAVSRASIKKSDPLALVAIGAAHEILHQYLLKADKLFFGTSELAKDHYDEKINLNATGVKMGTYEVKYQIGQSALKQANEGTVTYIMEWQKIYITGYFKAINAGIKTNGNDAGKESTFKYIFNSSGILFKMQMSGLRSFRSLMVGDKPKNN